MEGVVCYGVDDPGPAAGRGPVRREHHAAQGPRDRRAGAGAHRRPARLAAQLSDPLRRPSSDRSAWLRAVDLDRRPAEDGGPLVGRQAGGQLPRRSTTSAYGAASRHTGQSEPNSSRRGPNSRGRSRRTARGRRPATPPSPPRSRARTACTTTFGSSPNGASELGPRLERRRRGSAAWPGGRRRTAARASRGRARAPPAARASRTSRS